MQLVGLFGSHSDSKPWTLPENTNVIVIGLSKSHFQFSVIDRRILI